MLRMYPPRRLSDLSHLKVPLQFKRHSAGQTGGEVSQALRGVPLALPGCSYTREQAVHQSLSTGDVEALLEAGQRKQTEVAQACSNSPVALSVAELSH